MRLTVRDRENLRQQVQNFIVKNGNPEKSMIVNHFSKEGFARSTIYNAINKLATSEPIKERKRTGRPSSWTASRVKSLKRLAVNRKSASTRKLASKFQVDQSTICRKLSKLNIRYYKRQKTPKYTTEQQGRAQKLSRKLVNHLYGQKASVIIDDEKYFEFSNDNLPSNVGFYTNNKETCPDDVKYKGVKKFPPKILVWVAISEHGMSKPLIMTSKSVSINQTVYLEKCLQKRLLPFIHDYYPDFNYIFWPDLASSHYANSCVDWMEENIYFVPKAINPPNVPQARPIENFWGCLSEMVYKDGWQAKTVDQLANRIRAKLREIDPSFLQSIMKGVKTKLRKIADEGVFSPIK